MAKAEGRALLSYTFISDGGFRQRGKRIFRGWTSPHVVLRPGHLLRGLEECLVWRRVLEIYYFGHLMSNCDFNWNDATRGISWKQFAQCLYTQQEKPEEDSLAMWGYEKSALHRPTSCLECSAIHARCWSVQIEYIFDLSHTCIIKVFSYAINYKNILGIILFLWQLLIL